MEYIKITKENIDKEYICCPMSEKQGARKKEWLKKRFDDGLVFYRSVEREKCFIEYLPSENAWVPIETDNYIFIDCLWITGKLKGYGYSNDLLNECINDAISNKKQGICILSSEGRKKEFLSDTKYLMHKGFKVADIAGGITLMYLPLTLDAIPPRFKECAKTLEISDKGIVIYYTDQCPFAYYWVQKTEELAQKNNILLKIIHITDKQTAQNISCPMTNYAVFKDGKFVTNIVQTDKKILALTKI